MIDVGQAAAESRWEARPVIVQPRSPGRAALLSLVTVSLYGFWWWWDTSRQLRALGQPADPRRALAAVTAGWLAVVPPFRSVHRTMVMIAGAQRSAGLPVTAKPAAAVAATAVTAAGAIAWFAMAFAAVSAGVLLGLVWPLIAMAFIGYVQRELNRAVSHRGG